MRKIIISDYDETMIKHSGECYNKVCLAVLGKNEFDNVVNGKSYFYGYKERNLLTKDQVIGMLEMFKTTEVYKEFCNNLNDDIKKVLNKFNNIPNKNFSNFIVNDILFPLIAYYDVYVAKLTPEEKFFELYKNAKENNDIFLINTFKDKPIIETELYAFIKLNNEKYGCFKEIIDNGLLFSTESPECSKGNKDRIQYILRKISKKINIDINYCELILMGDSMSDVNNYEEAVSKCFPQSSKFLFVNSRLVEDPNKNSENIFNALNDEVQKITIKQKELDDIETKLNEINNINKFTNHHKGSYNQLAEAIYTK